MNRELMGVQERIRSSIAALSGLYAEAILNNDLAVAERIGEVLQRDLQPALSNLEYVLDLAS